MFTQSAHPKCSLGGNTLGAHFCPRGTQWGKTVGKIWAPVEHCGGTLWGQTLGPHFDGDPCEGTLCGHTLGNHFKEYLGSSGALLGDTVVAKVRPQDVPLKGHPKCCLKVCTQSVPSSVPFDLNCPPKCAPRVALLSQRVYPQCSPKVSPWGEHFGGTCLPKRDTMGEDCG